MRWTRTLGTSLAVVALCMLFMAAPAAALSEEPERGPMPLAFFGTILGATVWVVSVPFTALIAPTHVMDSFDTLVIEPWRWTLRGPDES